MNMRVSGAFAGRWPLAVVSAGAAAVLVVGMTAARDNDNPADREAMTHATMTAVVEQGPERRAAIDSGFLADFNSRDRRYEDLRRDEISAAGAGPYSLDEARIDATLVVIADLESMTFVTSGFADMPVSRWILHVSATMKGDAAPGDLVELNVLGGPVQRQPERPDLFVTLPGLQIPSLGDRLVLFLQPADGHGPLELVNTRNMYIIEDGRVVDDESARIAGIVGMSEAELITLLTRNPDTQP